MSLNEEEKKNIRQNYRRCEERVIEAIIAYREVAQPELVPTIVFGILERYAPPSAEARDLSKMPKETRLAEDLGIDSLTMLEAVLAIEEVLNVRIENEELRQIRTLGEVIHFCGRKSSGEKDEPAVVLQSRFNRAEIEKILPQGDPFLFVDSAEINGNEVKAVFAPLAGGIYFQGHFKDKPVLPAAILCEALGQVACLSILSKEGKAGNPVYVLNMEDAHFRRMVVPGDVLDLSLSLLHDASPLYHFTGEARVKGDVVARLGKIILISGDMQEPAA